MTTALQALEGLMRRPAQAAEECATTSDPRPLVTASLAAIVVGAGSFGAVLATSRGGVQLVYSAAKLPLSLLATLTLVVPAFYAFSAALGRPLRLGSVVALVLAATARAALVLLALAPVVWLAFEHGLGYHGGVLLASAVYAFAGLSALTLLRHGVARDWRGAAIIACFGLVLLPSAGQTAWMLRPFLGRPAQATVPFFRAREGSFADSVYRSGFASVGDYRSRTPATEADRDAD